MSEGKNIILRYPEDLYPTCLLDSMSSYIEVRTFA